MILTIKNLSATNVAFSNLLAIFCRYFFNRYQKTENYIHFALLSIHFKSAFHSLLWDVTSSKRIKNMLLSSLLYRSSQVNCKLIASFLQCFHHGFPEGSCLERFRWSNFMNTLFKMPSQKGIYIPNEDNRPS